MIELLIWLLVVLIIFAIVWYAITLLPLPPPFHIVAQLVLLIIFLIAVLAVLLPLVRGPPVLLR